MMSGAPDCSSDMTDDVRGRLDYEDLASRVCELVSRPARTEEEMRRYARRQAREAGDSSSCSTFSSLESDNSVDDGSSSDCSVVDDDSLSVGDHALRAEDQALRGRTNMLMSDFAEYVSYVDTSRSSVELLVGDASIMSRIRRAPTSSAGRDPDSEWRHEPIRGRRRSSDIESCGDFLRDVDMNEDGSSSYFEGARSVRDLISESRIRRAPASSAGRDLWRHEPIRGRRRSSDIESCGDYFQDIDMNEDGSPLDFEGARFAARDVLARADVARQSRHESNGFLGGSGLFLVLFGVMLGILMSVALGGSMGRREMSQQHDSLPGSSLGRTRMSPPRRPSWSISNVLSSAMPSTLDGAREKYDPRWYDFKGTYSDSFTFCSRHESRIPCPYSVYCPSGRGSASASQYEGGQTHDTNDRPHVPIVDLPFGWARLGAGSGEDGNVLEDTCSVRIETDNEASVEVSSRILCCREAPLPEAPLPEENEVESNFVDGNQQLSLWEATELRKYVESDNEVDARDDLLRQRLDPVWFDSLHGWSGELEGSSCPVLPLAIF